jgi:hypothetical protein
VTEYGERFQLRHQIVRWCLIGFLKVFQFDDLVDVGTNLMDHTYHNVGETAKGVTVEAGCYQIGPVAVEVTQVFRLFWKGREKE